MIMSNEYALTLLGTRDNLDYFTFFTSSVSDTDQKLILKNANNASHVCQTM